MVSEDAASALDTERRHPDQVAHHSGRSVVENLRSPVHFHKPSVDGSNRVPTPIDKSGHGPGRPPTIYVAKEQQQHDLRGPVDFELLGAAGPGTGAVDRPTHTVIGAGLGQLAFAELVCRRSTCVQHLRFLSGSWAGSVGEDLDRHCVLEDHKTSRT
jgi:hypothetical protein